MKIFISCDMEGIACVTHTDHTRLEGPEYEMARHWMTAEVAAAVEGAREAGGSEFVVADSHGHMRNLLPDELPEDVLLVRGSPRPLSMMEGVDSSFDAAFLIGYHSMAGTGLGVLSHTYIGSSIYNLRLNGKTVGEPGFNGAVAGAFKVPVALACGDDTVDAEVADIMPWSERVITKWAISTICAKNLTPKASQRKIRTAAKRAVERLNEMKPLGFDTPIHVEVDFMRPLAATIADDVPGVERIGNRTLAFTAPNMVDVMKLWRVVINASLGEMFV